MARRLRTFTSALAALGLLAVAGPPALASSVITVSTTSDAVNGNVSSPAALIADPGLDGISLREAIEATNNDPGPITIAFASSLQGATIAVNSQLPPLSGGGVTIEGDIDGDGAPDVTLSEAAGFSGGYCAAVSGCGFAISSSGNRLHAITLEGFYIGVDIEPWHPGDEALLALPTHQTLSDNVIAGLVMHGIQDFGVLLDSVYNQNCGLFSGHAQPCTSDDTWSNTTIIGNSIETTATGDTAIAAKIFNSGDRLENTTVTGNTIVEGDGTVHDAGIALEVLGAATTASISGGLISGNAIDGSIGQGIDIASGSNRAQANTVENVQVLDNYLNLVGAGTGFCCQGIVVQAGSDAASAIYPDVSPLAYPDGNVTQNIVVRGNTVGGTLQEGVVLQSGLGAGGSDNRVENVDIQHNTIASSTLGAGVTIWTASGNPIGDRYETDNEIAGVTVEANRITIGTGPGAPPLRTGGVLILGGGSFGRDGRVSDTQIVNNVIGPGPSTVLLIGGSDPSANGNHIDGVLIVNDTIADQGSPGLQVIANEGSSGNVVSAVSVVNTIFSGGFAGEVVPSMVSSSIVSDPRFAGINGNVRADPKFIDAAHGDYHLRAGSPAINAGSSSGAPATDFDGNPRSDGHVDIGAFEFDEAGTPAPVVSSFSPNHGTAGTSVTITGSGFAGAAAVAFGGTAAGSFAAGSDSTITATIAAGTMTGPVSVTGPGGTTASSALFYLPPTIGDFSPANAPAHATVAVTGTSFAGATQVELGGVSVPFSVTSNTRLTFTIPAGSPGGAIQVIAPGGSATSGGRVAVPAPPTITSISPRSGPIGTTVTITGANLGGTVGVMLGSVITVPRSVGPTSVTFAIPPGATSGRASVLTTSGSATSTDVFTVTG